VDQLQRHRRIMPRHLQERSSRSAQVLEVSGTHTMLPSLGRCRCSLGYSTGARSRHPGRAWESYR
jgi:hypothetical protein